MVIEPMSAMLIAKNFKKIIKVIMWIIVLIALFIYLAIIGIIHFLFPQVTTNQPVTTIDPPPYLLPLFVNAGAKYNVPWAFLATINRIETNYGTSASEISSAGALGPMQFLPSTFAEYGKGNPFDYVDAVMASANMFHHLGMTTSQMTGSNQIHYVQLYAGSYNAGASNWDNMSYQTTNYRYQALLFYNTIRTTTKIPNGLIQYWVGLNHSQLEKIVNHKMSIYPKAYHGKKVVEISNVNQYLPKGVQKSLKGVIQSEAPTSSHVSTKGSQSKKYQQG